MWHAFLEQCSTSVGHGEIVRCFRLYKDAGNNISPESTPFPLLTAAWMVCVFFSWEPLGRCTYMMYNITRVSMLNLRLKYLLAHRCVWLGWVFTLNWHTSKFQVGPLVNQVGPSLNFSYPTSKFQLAHPYYKLPHAFSIYPYGYSL